MSVDEAEARHGERNLLPLLEALQLLPRTPTRQGLIDDLIRFHFQDEFPDHQPAAKNPPLPVHDEPVSPEVMALLDEFFAQHSDDTADQGRMLTKAQQKLVSQIIHSALAQANQ